MILSPLSSSNSQWAVALIYKNKRKRKFIKKSHYWLPSFQNGAQSNATPLDGTAKTTVASNPLVLKRGYTPPGGVYTPWWGIRPTDWNTYWWEKGRDGEVEFCGGWNTGFQRAFSGGQHVTAFGQFTGPRGFNSAEFSRQLGSNIVRISLYCTKINKRKIHERLIIYVIE